MEIQYLTNAKGKKKAIVLPIKMYEKLLDKLDELEDIRLYNEAKKMRKIIFLLMKSLKL